jgi:tetratricopeptide (TPR) repeat protein
MPEAVTDLERALALFRQAGEDQRFVATSLVLLEVLWWTVRLEEAGGVCRRALDALGTAESPLRPLLLFAAASLAALSNDMAAARPLLDQACTLPVWTAPGLDRLVARIETMTRFTCTQLEEACKRGAECARLCESAGDVWGQADVAWVRAAMAINLGRLDEGASIAREAIPLSERIGHWGNAFFCRELLYNARFAAGDLECAGEAAAFVEEYERLHFAPWCVKTKVDLANVARLRGRIGEAVEWCRRAQVPEPNHWAGYPRAALALALVQGGDAGAADALADALRYALRAGEKAPYGRWPTLNLLIEALATAGRLEDAAALAPATEDMLALGFRVMWAGAALPRTAAGIAAACAREWDRAERHHQAAIEQADTMSLRVCQPIARYWYASMLLARAGPGDPSRSLTLFSEAQSMFLSLGIPLYARRAGEQVAALR